MTDSKPCTARLGFSIAALLAVLAAPCAIAQTGAPLTEGEKLIARQDWEAAEDHFYDLVQANPQNAEYLRKLGFVELRRPGGDAVRARQYLERANAVEPQEPVGLFLLAKAYEVSEMKDQAKSTYDKLIEIGPGRDNPTQAGAVHLARFARGLIALQDGDLERARPLFDEVLIREKNNGYVLYERALLVAASGSAEEAVAAFEAAQKGLDSWSPTETWPYPQGRYAYVRENVRFELGKYLVAAGRPGDALPVLEPVVAQVKLRDGAAKRPVQPPPRSPLQGDTDARFESAPFYYGEALAATGRKDEAQDILKEFSRMRIGDPDLRSKARDRARELR